jgi:hypothetical protein
MAAVVAVLEVEVARDLLAVAVVVAEIVAMPLQAAAAEMVMKQIIFQVVVVVDLARLETEFRVAVMADRVVFMAAEAVKDHLLQVMQDPAVQVARAQFLLDGNIF